MTLSSRSKRQSFILALFVCTISSLIGLAQATNCKTFYFHAEIYVAGISSCSNRQRKRLGAFINRVINDAFKNINVISFNAKVCSTPIEYYSDDDGYNYTDDARRDLMPFLDDMEYETEMRVSETRMIVLDDASHNQKDIQTLKEVSGEEERAISVMIEDNEGKAQEDFERLLRFGDFYYVGGGRCRLCVRDDKDSRRSLGSFKISFSSRSSTNGEAAYAKSSWSGTGDANHAVSISTYSSRNSAFHYSSTYSWKDVEPQLEQSLSQYLTRATETQFQSGCIDESSLNISVDLIRKPNKRASKPQC